MSSIMSLDAALLSIKEPSRSRYKKTWQEFQAFSSDSSEYTNRMPSEEELTSFFKHLREEKKMASSSMWTYYSQINKMI